MMKKRKLQLMKKMAGILMLCLLISVIPTTAFAQNNSKEKYNLTIRTEKEFINFMKSIDNGTTYSGKVIKLENDIRIKATNVNDFNLVFEVRQFSGVFDGGCHTISGIRSWGLLSDFGSESEGALFGTITSTGVVKNLYIEGFSFNNNDRGVSVIAVKNEGLIDNCRIKDCNLNASSAAAGISYMNEGEIRNCTVEGSIVSDGVYSGGVAVWNYGSVNNCAFIGTVERKISTKGPYLAGLTCENNGTIQNSYCVVKNEQSTSGEKIYGICGRNGGILLNCYCSDEGVEYAYESDNGTVDNINMYSGEEMKKSSFVKQMNSNLSSNYLKWCTSADSDYPSLISLNEVTFKSIDSKKGYVKSNKSYAYKGQKVTLTPVMTKKYKVSSITVKTSNGNKVKATKNSKGAYVFSMPDDKVVVTAKIVKKK